MENSWRALFFKSLLSKVPLPVDFNLGVPQKQTPQPLCLLSCQWVPEACVLAPKNLQSNSVLSLEKENSLLHGHLCGPAASENRWEGEQWKAPAGSLNVGTTGPWWMFMVFNFLRRWDFCLRVSKISISTLFQDPATLSLQGCLIVSLFYVSFTPSCWTRVPVDIHFWHQVTFAGWGCGHSFLSKTRASSALPFFLRWEVAPPFHIEIRGAIMFSS